MKFSDFSTSQTVKITLIVIGVIVVLLAGFSFGEHIGFRKASFAFQNGNHFYQTFGTDHAGMMEPHDFSDANSTVGKVLSVTLPTITIEDRDNTEKTILINAQTVIRQFRDTLQPTDIKVGDFVVAIGQPNAQSQITASLIRELPQ